MRACISWLRKPSGEDGFTLIELMVVIVIMGILGTIAVPISNGIRREAAIASVKSDISSSVPSILQGVGNRDGLFASAQKFTENAAITSPNNLVLVVSGEGLDATACIWGSHVFGENDVVSFHYSSLTGKIADGTCLGDVASGIDPENSEVVVGTGPTVDDPSTPVDEKVEEEEAEAQMPVTPTVPSVTPTPPPSQVGAGGGSTAPTTPPVVAPAPAPPVVTPPTISEPKIPTSKNKYPVCHGAGGSWHLLMLPLSAIANGHNGHSTDIIPPITQAYTGKNWNQAGWVTFNKYCA